MPIIEPAIRPPSEAYSYLLQVTVGCSADRCTFCGAYKGKPFRAKDLKEITADIEAFRDGHPEAAQVRGAAGLLRLPKKFAKYLAKPEAKKYVVGPDEAEA